MSGRLSPEQSLFNATKRITQRDAKDLVKKQRREALEKEKQERMLTRKQLQIGKAILVSALGEWDTSTLIGMMLYGRERALESQTMKLSFKSRGEAFLTPRTRMRGGGRGVKTTGGGLAVADSSGASELSPSALRTTS